MAKRFTALLLALCLCLALGGSCLAYSGVSGWAEAEVAQAEALGFLPQSLQDSALGGSMTRLEMCQLAVNAFEVITNTSLYPAATDHFTDTRDDDVCIAYELKIVSGYTDGSFRPQNAITRQEFSKIVGNLLSALNWSREAQLLGQFSDEATLSGWAKDAAATVLELEIVKGNTDGTLNPTGSTSIEQALVMFLRAYDKLTSLSGSVGVIPPAENDLAAGYTCSSWARASVDRMALLGLLPESLLQADMTRPITRAQMCQVAVLTWQLITGKQAQPGSAAFSDTDDPSIQAAYALGLVSGFPDGSFRPEQTLTRQQFFQITYNLLTCCGYAPETDEALLQAAFTDAADISAWAQSSIAALYRLGVMQGNANGTVAPQSGTTREQAIVLFLRAYQCIRDWYSTHPLQQITGPLTELSRVMQVVNYALSLEGKPYVWASTDPNVGFDCSGFVYHVYNHLGYSLHRTTSAMLDDGIAVTREQLQPGDILFFASNGTASITHVALAIGEGKMIHAANTLRGVVIDSIDYDQSKYIYAIRRVIQ